uniref:Uncharacterized protein n=1 Tax=Siphoviridae sp. ctDmR33 TaxID=2825389 RepID=A0A8S5UX82_9CAUD|nr:MAG TPA: hypothetical protein [Siphoviridae sp. ctDmR33]
MFVDVFECLLAFEFSHAVGVAHAKKPVKPTSGGFHPLFTSAKTPLNFRKNKKE